MAHFVSNVVVMATTIGRVKICLAVCDSPTPKTIAYPRTKNYECILYTPRVSDRLVYVARDRSRSMASLNKTSIVSGISELRFYSHRTFKHEPLSRVFLCVSGLFLFFLIFAVENAAP